jgi:hypothetical protein
MYNSEQYRAKAAEYEQRAGKTDIASEIRELKDLERSFRELADNEAWVEQNFEKIVHGPPK